MGQRILWSNMPGELLPDHLIPCFPFDDGGGICLDETEVEFLKNSLSNYYTEILHYLSLRVADYSGADYDSCRIILREAVVLITYTFADRLMRLSKVLATEKETEIGTPLVDDVPFPETNAQFMVLVAGSQKFNQYLLSKLASRIFHLPVLAIKQAATVDIHSIEPVKNLNFDQPSYLVRVRRKYSKVLSKWLGRFPTLRLANIEAPLLDCGIYGQGSLMWLDDLELDTTFVKNIELRASVSERLNEDLMSLLSGDLFKNLGLDSYDDRTKAVCVFCEMLLELIPVEKIEGVLLYKECEDRLKLISPPALFFCGMPSSKDIYWIAAARKLRISVIGVQHGAHYGFTSQPSFVDTEFAYCDLFFSWGWRDFPESALCANILAVPLPSPWLSERAKCWRSISLLRHGKRHERPSDVLLMSDRIQIFPPTVSTLRMSRRDFISRLNATTYNIVFELASRKIRVLNKPYDYISRDMQSVVLKQLLLQFPNYYREYKLLNKGLTADLLQSAWLILWDEPGTGFFECLVSGIPTMLYWERLTSSEEVYARPYFKQLEDIGLLHDSPISLANEIALFLDDPDLWLRNEKRLVVIRDLVDQFAKTSDLWMDEWKVALKGLTKKV